jgi:putative RNA 2'-phosphotransferase
VTDPIYRCSDDGFTTIPRCPECGRDAETVLLGNRRRRLSKFVSGALRHFPADAGIELDDGGWTSNDDLAEAITRKYDWAESEHLTAVVATDPKGRFERTEVGSKVETGGRIRAAYGHSVDGPSTPTGTDKLEKATFQTGSTTGQLWITSMRFSRKDWIR